MPPAIDLSAQRFGRLIVVRRANSTGACVRWMCICDCGRPHEVSSNALRMGETKSCGCLKNDILADRSKTHGHARGRTMTGEYRCWISLRQRCSNPHVEKYPNYGGRGIKVCDRWNESFENFLADMGPKPSPKHTIDRKDNDGNYEPGNCRWATPTEQAKNRRPRRTAEGACHQTIR